MSDTQFIALDFGASSGRAILATIGKTIHLDEVHRFPNLQIKINSHYYWDILRLYHETIQGLKNTSQKVENQLSGIGVDTWGVDFGLIDKKGMLLSNPVCYRDPRTHGIMEKVFEKISKEEIYRATGIQFMQLNTIYQLMSLVESQSAQLKIADHLLFIPDLIGYFLTGEKKAEYTIASTSQLLNARTHQWESSIFEKLNLPITIMPEIQNPGTIRGRLLQDIADETGLGRVDVIATGAHDTASAVAAVPVRGENWAYISSGTWSLIGVEVDEPIITEASLQYNFTNEGGAGQKIRFLKNVMGMWLLESCVRIWEKSGKKYGYNELIELAEQTQPFQIIIDPDDDSFLNPSNMIQAIQRFCQIHNQKVPETKGEIIRTILESLAFRYRWTLEKIKEMQSKEIDTLHIVGGGSQNRLLNQFTANATGCCLMAGPVEATALGNILIQAVNKGVIDSIQAGRILIENSFPTNQFNPQDRDIWDKQYHKIKSIFD